MILTYLYCVLGVAKYRGDWGWEKQKRASEPVLIYSSSSWAKYSFYTMVPLRPLIWLAASIPSCMWLLRTGALWGRSIVLPSHVIKGWLCIAARGCALRPFYCSSFPCDKRMINQSGDLVCFCLSPCLLLFVVGAYKKGNALGGRSSFPSLPPSSLLLQLNNHVFPCLYFLPIFVQGGRLCSRRGGVNGTGRGSR